MRSYFQTKFMLNALKTTAGAACVTLGGTAVGCLGALFVERSAHRTLYRFFPHLYRDVEYAFGLDPHLLEELRSVSVEPIFLHADEANEWEKNADWMEQHAVFADRSSTPISKINVKLCSCALTS